MAWSKPSVYLDASFISAYWYAGANLAMLSRRYYSREWWSLERRRFQILASEFVDVELGHGRYRWQSKCIAMVRRLRYIQSTVESIELTDTLIAFGVVPSEKHADAAHLALTIANDVDYLLTWNYAHLANPLVQMKLNDLCRQQRLRPPLLVTPETIPQARLGQPIRRKRHQ
jgi:hypothetical protein